MLKDVTSKLLHPIKTLKEKKQRKKEKKQRERGELIAPPLAPTANAPVKEESPPVFEDTTTSDSDSAETPSATGTSTTEEAPPPKQQERTESREWILPPTSSEGEQEPSDSEKREKGKEKVVEEDRKEPDPERESEPEPTLETAEPTLAVPLYFEPAIALPLSVPLEENPTAPKRRKHYPPFADVVIQPERGGKKEIPFREEWSSPSSETRHMLGHRPFLEPYEEPTVVVQPWLLRGVPIIIGVPLPSKEENKGEEAVTPMQPVSALLKSVEEPTEAKKENEPEKIDWLPKYDEQGEENRSREEGYQPPQSPSGEAPAPPAYGQKPLQKELKEEETREALDNPEAERGTQTFSNC